MILKSGMVMLRISYTIFSGPLGGVAVVVLSWLKSVTGPYPCAGLKVSKIRNARTMMPVRSFALAQGWFGLAAIWARVGIFVQSYSTSSAFCGSLGFALFFR